MINFSAFCWAESRGRSLGGPLALWNSLMGFWEVVRCPLGGPCASSGVPGGRWGVPRRPGGLCGEGPRGTENTEDLFRVSCGCAGAPLELFWSSGVGLGTDLGNGHVDIFLFWDIFVKCVFLYVFFICICKLLF